MDAFVDFGELDERRIVRSEDGTSLTITLPAPTLGEPRLNLKTSSVELHDEGLITKWNGSDLEQKAQREAVEKMAAGARADAGLLALARESTTRTLKVMFGSSGFANVDVYFDEPPVKQT